MEDNGGSKFVYFVMGLGIGALIGVLFAPQAGEQTRELSPTRPKRGGNTCCAKAAKSATRRPPLRIAGRKSSPSSGTNWLPRSRPASRFTGPSHSRKAQRANAGTDLMQKGMRAEDVRPTEGNRLGGGKSRWMLLPRTRCWLSWS